MPRQRAVEWYSLLGASLALAAILVQFACRPDPQSLSLLFWAVAPIYILAVLGLHILAISFLSTGLTLRIRKSLPLKAMWPAGVLLTDLLAILWLLLSMVITALSKTA